MILYGSEIFPTGEAEIKVQRKAARTIIGAPGNTSSTALFEYLGWIRVEAMADLRCLYFGERLRSTKHPIIEEAFQLACSEQLPWFQRFSSILEKYQLNQDWIKQSNWKSAAKQRVNEFERNFWRDSLNIKDLDDNSPFSANIPGKGSSIIWNGFGLNAKAAFFFRYSYPAHYHRHQSLQHFNSSCPLCGNEYGSPKHLIFECNANLCSNVHRNRLFQHIELVRGIYRFSNCLEPSEEDRLLAVTGPGILDYETANALQQSFTAIHRMWCRYDASRPREKAPPRESTYHLATEDQQIRNIKLLYETEGYQEKLQLVASWNKDERTIRRWFENASEKGKLPEGSLSVAAHLDLHKRIDRALRYSKCKTASERKAFIQQEGVNRSTVSRNVSIAREHGYL